MITKELPVGVITPFKDDYLYRDSYNQVWLIRRRDEPFIPLTISLYEKLTEPIGVLESLLRKKS